MAIEREQATLHHHFACFLHSYQLEYEELTGHVLDAADAERSVTCCRAVLYELHRSYPDKL